MEDPETPEDIRKILEQCIHPKPKGEFVKAHFLLELFGIKFCRYENAIKTSPRDVQVDEVAELLRPLLETLSRDAVDAHHDEHCNAIREILRQHLKGENYGSYVRPSPDVLAKGACFLLDNLFHMLPKKWVIHIERVTIAVLEEFEPEWFTSMYDMSTAIQALCLVRSTTGHRTIITVSFFTMVAENTRMTARVRTVEAYYTTLQLSYESGNCTLEHLQHQKKLLTSFLMALEFGGFRLPNTHKGGDGNVDDEFCDDDENEYDDELINCKPDGNFQKARILLMPKGYFKGPRGRILTVSRNLGIGYNETLRLRIVLGMELFCRMLVACGLLHKGRQPVSPIEVNFKCPGVLPFGGFTEALPCTSNGDYSAGFRMVTDENHPLYGLWRCNNCMKKYHKQQTRPNRVNALGLSTVQREERLIFQAFAARQRDLLEQGDSVAIQRQEDRRAYYQQWYQSRKNKNCSSGDTWKKKGENFRYPQPVTDLLSRALQEWIVVYRDKVVLWTDVVALFRDICDLESPTYKNDSNKKIRKMFDFIDDQIVYYYPAFEQVALQYLNRPILPAGQRFSKTWPVKNEHVPCNHKTYVGDKQAKAELRYLVLETLYTSD